MLYILLLHTDEKEEEKKLYLMFTFTKLADCQPIILTLKLNFPDVHARLIFEVSS